MGRREGEKSEFKAGNNHSSTYTATQINVLNPVIHKSKISFLGR